MTSRGSFLIAIAVLLIAALYALSGPIPQDPSYHRFVDDRTLLGIRNAQNVLSNAGFLVVGWWGTVFLLGPSGKAASGDLRATYAVFVGGVFLTAFGSAWYHWRPDNQSLVWDRLPMIPMIIGFSVSVVGELIDVRVAKRLLWPLTAVGLASVIWWAWTESGGSGDLRAYAVVRFLPLLLVIPIIFMYEGSASYKRTIGLVLGLTATAQVCELYDVEIYRFLQSSMGGHALKHLFVAAATSGLLFILVRRGRVEQEPYPGA